MKRPIATRLVLNEGQTAFVRNHGIHFALVHPGSTEVNGRMVLDLVALDSATANAAIGVAIGTHTARRKPKA